MKARCLLVAIILGFVVLFPPPKRAIAYINHGNASAPYLGAAFTRGLMATSVGNHYAMSISGHFARVNVTAVRMIYGCFYGNPETTTGGPCTYTGGLQFPSGAAPTQVTFNGGATSIVIPDGSYGISDSISVSTTSGTLIGARTFCTNVNGQCPTVGNVWPNSHIGLSQVEAATCSSTSITDHTMDTSTITASCSSNVLYPIAILATITQPSLCLFGDSIAYGTNDAQDSSGDEGILTRSIGPSFGYIQSGISGSTAANWATNNSSRSSIANSYCTDIVIEYGLNDLVVVSAAATLTRLKTVWGSFATSKRVYQTTITPDTSSTDSHATPGNQSDLLAGKNATLNTSLLAGQSGLRSVFDVASIVANGGSSTTSPELWLTNGSANYCVGPSDNVHPTNACYLLVESSGIIPSSTFHYP